VTAERIGELAFEIECQRRQIAFLRAELASARERLRQIASMASDGIGDAE
jgi:Tfp pilus assembly protein PilN